VARRLGRVAASPRPSSASLARLRYFRYVPPLGGFGGDWDLLCATACFADAADLARILALFGYTGAPALAERHTSLGFFTVADVSLQLTVNQQAFFPSEVNTIAILLAIYVTAEDVKKARKVEAWLDAHGITMLPRL
jgi:hypothetical protein